MTQFLVLYEEVFISNFLIFLRIFFDHNRNLNIFALVTIQFISHYTGSCLSLYIY